MIYRKLEECINGELQSNFLEKCDNKNRMDCIKSSDRRSVIKCEENKKKYMLENTKRNHVILYKMDGGIIAEDKSVPLNTSKCDYLFVIGDATPTAVLTELKGVNVPKALIQLKGTLLLDIEPEILIRMREAFRNLKADGKLHHGSGTFKYGDWGVWL